MELKLLAGPRGRSACGIAQHFEEPHFDGSGEKLVKPTEQRLQVRSLEMGVEIGSAPPVLIENEDIGILHVDVEVVVDSARLGARRLDHAGEDLAQFLARFVLGDDGADEGAELHDTLSFICAIG
jgi:hypothetical protein